MIAKHQEQQKKELLTNMRILKKHTLDAKIHKVYERLEWRGK